MSVTKLAYIPNRPTHFLSLPVSSPMVQRRARELTQLLLNAQAEGVDESLVVQERSLHLTVGIMQLAPKRSSEATSSQASGKQMCSVDDAASLLQSLEADLQDYISSDLGSETLQDLADPIHKSGIDVHFDRLESFQSDSTKCRVLYAEPEKAASATKTLHSIASFVRERFHAQGMLADHNQPLTLHCTLMKASARRNKPESHERLGVDTVARAFPDSKQGEQAMLDQDDRQRSNLGYSRPPSKRKNNRSRSRFPKKIPFDASLLLDAQPPHSLGVSAFDRIQLCQMGRLDSEGRYEVLEEIRLFREAGV